MEYSLGANKKLIELLMRETELAEWQAVIALRTILSEFEINEKGTLFSHAKLLGAVKLVLQEATINEGIRQVLLDVLGRAK